LIVAGVDPTGTHLFGCQAHGSTDKLPYMTLGSGSLAAMGVLETEFRLGMEKEDAMDLVCRAVLAGVWNDLGSGGSVDLVVMEKDQVCSSIDITDVLAYSDYASLFLSQSTTN
jgi:20S proteasome subunit beta 2